MERPAKIFQYLMLILLFSLAFLLPALAVKKQEARKTAEQTAETKAAETPGQTAETKSAETPGQTAETKAAETPGQTAETKAAETPGQTAETKAAETPGQTTENTATETPGAGSDSPALGKIVIDAGHGGFDPGMTGSSGANEKVLNLIYAKKLQALLEKAGYQVVQTRETEDGLYDPDQSNKKAQDMQRRCAIIEAEQPLLTVSIHQNSYSDPVVCGPQVFYYEHSAEGELLAASIQEALNEQLAVSHPRTHKANGSYYILKRSAGTAVIVECGFLSNPEEEAKLQQEEYQDKVAQAICDGVTGYLKTGQDQE